MTNQEAIKRIKEHIAIHKYRESHAIHIVEALEMAISALQEQDLQPNLQQTCNLATDCISRSAALDVIRNIRAIAGSYDSEMLLIDKAEAQTELMMLPSAQPDLSGYSDRLWKAAYERGKAEAQPDIIHCRECIHYNAGFECLIEGYGIERDKDWFCGSAERRTFVEIGTDDETFIGKYEAITEISDLPPAQPYTEAEIQKMQDLYQAEIDKAFELGQEDARSEIIHCGECKHRDPEDKKCDCGHDILWQLPREDEWYCADAERKEGEADEAD